MTSEPQPVARTPKNAIVVLLDSMNRHMLGAYGGREFATPNLDRFAARAVRFEKHYSGSLPCMPARHDMLCGALDFLWKPWGSIEIWEHAITHDLRAAGVTTMLISDHPHLFSPPASNGSRVPVIRQPFAQGDMLPFWAYGNFSGNHLYDLRNDPTEDENRCGERVEREAAGRLRQALVEIEAPSDQFVRLGLA
ncbi:MAG: sulfatase-like hydrolase/transferase [Dehalococcoidia bacterium]